MTAAGGASSTSPARRGSKFAVGLVLVVLAGALMAFLASRKPQAPPFDITSAAPDGYKAMNLLLSDHGMDVRQVEPSDVDAAEFSVGDVVLVPVPNFATDGDVDRYLEIARRGSLVVLGGVPGSEPLPPVEGFGRPTDRQLADLPAVPARPDICSIEDLSDLGPIDEAFAGRGLDLSRLSDLGRRLSGPDGSTPTVDWQFCYGRQDFDFAGAFVGKGRLVVLSSPYLWANARLVPQKESGGAPLDNAATGVRLMASASADGTPTVTVVAPVRSVVAGDGTKSVMELLPVPVKLAIVQMMAAFGLYVWWRSRRLGAPVPELMPAEIDGAELVSAVGNLLRRKGNPQRAAATLRADVRRQLSKRLGMGPEASVETLTSVVVGRTGLNGEVVRLSLDDGHIADAEALTRLAQNLESIRSEVLDDHASR